MSSIKYVVEIAERTDYPPELALSSAHYEDGNIYSLAIGVPTTEDTYWTNWGGIYDNPLSTDIQLFFSQYLSEVNSEAELLASDYTFYARTSSIIDINLPFKPWQYLGSLTQFLEERFYASAPKDSTNPQDITYLDGNGLKIKYPVRLAVPSLSLKLSDSVSGETRRGTFVVNLHNDDGLFDNIPRDNFFNAPITIKRTNVEVPTRDDYKVIRQGLVDYVKTSGNTLKITSAEYLRLFTDSVCKTFSLADYPNLDVDLVGTNIPIGYGNITKAPLTKIGDYDYIALDPDYSTGASKVLDDVGNSIEFTYSNGVITVAQMIVTVRDGDNNSIAFEYEAGSTTKINVDSDTEVISSVVDSDGLEANFTYSNGVITIEEPTKANVTGLTTDSIGAIITNEIASKSSVPYTSTNWDTEETDTYINESASIGFYFDDGSVSDLIADVLSNDSAFLLTKNDGRLTLRQWGRTYSVHRIPSHLIMSIPTIDTQASKKLHMTKVRVKYDYDEDAQSYGGTYLDDTRQLELVEKYSKSNLEEYKTKLKSETTASAFSQLLLDRFGVIPEIMSIDLGYDCTDINLLDTVVLDVKINKRQFSNKLFWTVVETDPAQDTLTVWSNETVGDTDLGLYGNSNIIYGYDENGAHGYKRES